MRARIRLNSKIVLAIFLVLSFAGLAAGGTPAQRPNILFLLTDDQRWDSLGCTGNALAQTPNIDQLAKRGTLFRNAFVTTSICCVSRASMFSGQYQSRHGIGDFKTPFSSAAFSNTYPAILRRSGYRTGFIGKFGVGDKLPEKEFDFWAGFPGQGKYFSGTNPQHLTAKMGDQALKFLQTTPGNQPFCLSISFKAPHALDGAPREFPPDSRDEKLYQDTRFPTPKTATDAAFKLLPKFVQTSEGHKRWQPRFATPEMSQQTTRDYFRLITGVDREVGRILKTLSELKLDTNTIIVFTSDNGMFLGDRGLADKWFMYEPSIRVPLIIVDPRAEKAACARQEEAMTLNIDIAPTLLDYAAAPAPALMQGHSLRPFVENAKVNNWRHEWFYEHHFGPQIIPPSEGVRTENWKYIRYVAAEPVVEELYDLKSDPQEEHNLVADPAHLATLDQLRGRWKTLRKEAQ